MKLMFDWALGYAIVTGFSDQEQQFIFENSSSAVLEPDDITIIIDINELDIIFRAISSDFFIIQKADYE